jgi:hypothetical protein
MSPLPRTNTYTLYQRLDLQSEVEGKLWGVDWGWKTLKRWGRVWVMRGWRWSGVGKSCSDVSLSLQALWRKLGWTWRYLCALTGKGTGKQDGGWHSWFSQWWNCCLCSSNLGLSSKVSKMIHWVLTASTCTLTSSVCWPEQLLNSIQTIFCLPLWVPVCSLLCLRYLLIDFHDLLTLSRFSATIKWEYRPRLP